MWGQSNLRYKAIVFDSVTGQQDKPIRYLSVDDFDDDEYVPSLADI